jgi:hypothetical protein
LRLFMGPRREVATLPALIRGAAQQRRCNVAAVRNPDRESPDIFKDPIKIIDNKDDFPDGTYQLVLGTQVFVLKKLLDPLRIQHAIAGLTHNGWAYIIVEATSAGIVARYWRRASAHCLPRSLMDGRDVS